jgi:hypothetical protein
MSENKYDIGLIVNSLEKVFPWIDKIETTTKVVGYGSSFNQENKMKSGVVDVVRIHFYYENPIYKQKTKNGPKEVKKEITNFLERYFNINVYTYGAPLELMFFEIGPRMI